jgi:outer membrane protein
VSLGPIRGMHAIALAALLAACAPVGADLVPLDSHTEYVPPAGAQTAGQPAEMPDLLVRPVIAAGRTYNLAALIDIAEENNPETRIAWQRARQAALGVGVAEALFLPLLSIDAVAGYQYLGQGTAGLTVDSSTIPGVSVTKNGLPTSITIPDGVVTTTTKEAVPSATLKWLLFDFGARAADVEVAKHLTEAAGDLYNASHQKVIYSVARSFFILTSARAQTRIARKTLSNSALVREAAEAKLARGLANNIEVAQARQLQAQARFDVIQSEGRERNAYATLLGDMGIAPTLKISVEDVSTRPLPPKAPASVDRLIDAALKQRPEVLAAYAKLKASAGNVERARAEFMPKVALTASAGQNIGDMTLHDSRTGITATQRLNQPAETVFVGVTIPLFDGGLRDNQLQIAEAGIAASKDELAALQLTAAREIVAARDLLETSLAAYRAAGETVRAAELTSKGALEYYRNGIGTMTEAINAQTALLQAQLAEAKAHSDALVAAATIVFSTGRVHGG